MRWALNPTDRPAERPREERLKAAPPAQPSRCPRSGALSAEGPRPGPWGSIWAPVTKGWHPTHPGASRMEAAGSRRKRPEGPSSGAWRAGGPAPPDLWYPASELGESTFLGSRRLVCGALFQWPRDTPARCPPGGHCLCRSSQAPAQDCPVSSPPWLRPAAKCIWEQGIPAPEAPASAPHSAPQTQASYT